MTTTKPKIQKLFRLVAHSTNTNSFGLRNYVFLARNGQCFEAARSDGDYHRRQFEIDHSFEIEDGGVRTIDDGFELYTKFPTPPADVINAVFSTKK